MVRLFILMIMFLMTYNVSAFETDTREKIVVIDTGIGVNQVHQPYICQYGVYDLFNEDGIDDHGHGTNIIGLIAETINPKTQCIVSVRTYSKTSALLGNNADMVLYGLAVAEKLQPKYINISAGGADPVEKEYQKILNLLKHNATIVVASGNDERNLDIKCYYYPACYKNRIPKQYRKNFYVISTNDLESSNRGSIVDAYISGKDKGHPVRSGTSQATAIFMSMKIAN